MAKTAGVKESDLIAFGHTTKPWTREVEDARFRNADSVSKPKDGDRRTGYVLVEVGDEIETSEFVRVEYDLERAMDSIRRGTLVESAKLQDLLLTPPRTQCGATRGKAE